MSKSHQLAQKMARKEKLVKQSVRGFDQRDKADQAEELMQRSSRVHTLMRGIKRRLDAVMGRAVTMKEPKMSIRANMTTLERFDFGGPDFGMKITMDAALLAQSGLQADDKVRY